MSIQLAPNIWIQIYHLTYLQRAELAYQYANDTLSDSSEVHTYLRKMKVGYHTLDPCVHDYIKCRFPPGSNVSVELSNWLSADVFALSINE